MACKWDKDPSRTRRQRLGFLRSGLDRLALKQVGDPRKYVMTVGILGVLRAALAGLLLGKRGLADVERMTEEMEEAACALLRIRGRLPDTTLRDVLTRVDPNDVRRVLHKQVRDAKRRKQFVYDLPVRAWAMDGKATATKVFGDAANPHNVAQRQGGHAVVRTVTTCEVSTTVQPCIDAYPVPADANEMSTYQDALRALIAAYGHDGADVVMYDAGACGRDNADFTIAEKLDYIFCLTGHQPTMMGEALRVLGDERLGKPMAEAVDVVNGKVLTRKLWLTGRLEGMHEWDHLRTVIRVDVDLLDKTTGEIKHGTHWYVSSLAPERMTAAQWMDLLRRRWGVEDSCHWTFDVAFKEDDHPWITEPVGMLVVMMLRRIAYNLLAFYRNHTLRAEGKRAMPWRVLMESLEHAVHKVTRALIENLRPRRPLREPRLTPARASGI